MTERFEVSVGSAERTMQVLGGRFVVGRTVNSPSELRFVLLDGLPFTTMDFLLLKLKFLKTNDADFFTAFEMSRTDFDILRRCIGQLPPELSLRVWLLAEIVGQAVEVLGTWEETSEWLRLPHPVFRRIRPIDLLGSVDGYREVKTHLDGAERPLGA